MIEICKLYNVPDEELWDPLLADAKKDNTKMPQLLNYVEAYQKPHRFMTYLNNETTLEDMRDPILGMFDRIDILNKILKKASK